MFKRPENYRQFELDRSIYRKLAETPQTEAESKEKKGDKTEPTLTPAQAWQKIDERYGKAIYAQVIQDQAAKIGPDGPEKQKLIQKCIEEYNAFYDEEKADFMRRARALRKAERHIERETRASLDELRQELVDLGPERKERRETRQAFRKLLRELNKQYFPHDEVWADWDYRDEVFPFKRQMRRRTMDRLEWMQQNGKSTEEIKAYMQEVRDTYDLYAKIDGKDASIGKEDLRVMNQAAKPGLKEVRTFITASTDTLDKRLELIATLDKRSWKEVIDMIGNSIINQAINDGVKDEFIQKVSTNIEPVYNFSQAKAAFKDHLEELSKASVKDLRQFLEPFAKDIFQATLDYETNIEPSSLKVQVGKQMDYLLGGVLVPEREEDKALVNFRKGDEEVRNRILSNDSTRETLFRAIRLATERYPEIFDKKYGNLPQEAKKLRRNPYIENPTSHDQAAQLKALIIIAQQDKALVEKYSQLPKHAGKGLMAELNKAHIPEDSKQVHVGLLFKAPGNKTQRYRSALERGGFNTRDLGLKGIKLLGVLASASNVAQAFADSEGDDLLDRMLNTGEKALGTPALWASAAVTVGAHMAERNKAFLRYHKLSDFEKKQAMLIYKLGNISARVGKKNADRFRGSEGEWSLLDRLDEAEIKDLLKTANERARKGGKPMITRELLVEKGLLDPTKDMATFQNMAEGPKVGRTRYLFYSKFFATKPKPDAHEVKQMLTGRGSIHPESTKNKLA